MNPTINKVNADGSVEVAQNVVTFSASDIQNKIDSLTSEIASLQAILDFWTGVQSQSAQSIQSAQVKL